jgi:hypothetical protein
MLADQYIAPLLIDALKAMEVLVVEQRNHIQQLELQLNLFRAGYVAAIARRREIDPSSSSSLIDGPTDQEPVDGSDRPASPNL